MKKLLVKVVIFGILFIWDVVVFAKDIPASQSTLCNNITYSISFYIKEEYYMSVQIMNSLSVDIWIPSDTNLDELQVTEDYKLMIFVGLYLHPYIHHYKIPATDRVKAGEKYTITYKLNKKILCDLKKIKGINNKTIVYIQLLFDEFLPGKITTEEQFNTYIRNSCIVQSLVPMLSESNP